MLEQEDILKLNKDFPVKLYKISHIIDQIHQKYPFIAKDDIVLICNTFFEKIREFILVGKIIRISKFLPKAHIFIYNRILDGKNQIFLKIKNGKI